MSHIRFPLKLGIGAKLGLSIGVGMLLVASIIAGDHYSNRVVSGLVAAADNQQAIVVESLTIDSLLGRAQIAGRDLRRAQTVEQITPLLDELDQVAERARGRMSALKELAASNETQKNFNSVSELTLSYIDALRKIGAEQAQILSLFTKLDDSEAVWVRSFHQLVGAPEYSFMPNVAVIEPMLNEAATAFLD